MRGRGRARGGRSCRLPGRRLRRSGREAGRCVGVRAGGQGKGASGTRVPAPPSRADRVRLSALRSASRAARRRRSEERRVGKERTSRGTPVDAIKQKIKRGADGHTANRLVGASGGGRDTQND